MSMNMLPMRFERDMTSPTGLEKFVTRVKTSRRTRYVIVGGVVACLVLLYLVTTGPGGYPTHSPGPWPMEDSSGRKGASTGPSQAQRAERVKSMFVRAYSAYEQHAFPHDELLPLSNGHQDK